MGVVVSVDGRDFFAVQRQLRWWSAGLVVGVFLLLWVLVNLFSGVHSERICPVEPENRYQCKTVADWSFPGFVVTAVVVAGYLTIGPWVMSRRLVPTRVLGPADGPGAVRLNNVVEEMAIASGVPVPEALIVDDPALNAFAVTDGRRFGAVVVTSGLLAALDRRQLAGVVAHELAHIRNRDSRVMLVAVCAVGPIIVAAMFFVAVATWLNARARRLRRWWVRWLVGIYVLAFAVFAALFRFGAVPAALLLRAALSRRREQLADASAVQYTRDPTALRTALERVAAGSSTARLPLLTRALCFVEPDGRPAARGVIERWMQANPTTALDRWIHTHPPIESRIAWLRSLEGASAANR